MAMSTNTASPTRLGKGLNRNEGYRTQRNNKVDPHGTCNVTRYAMAAKRAGCLWPHGDTEQPEDVFARFLLSKESVAHMQKIAPWAVGKHKPHTIHAMLEWGYNVLASDCGRAEFRTNWSLGELVYLVKQGAGVVISGSFPHYKLGRVGHLVSVVDAYYGGKLLEPSAFSIEKLICLAIDDPYGDYHTGYSPNFHNKGNEIEMNTSDVYKILQKGSEYWAHVILRTASEELG